MRVNDRRGLGRCCAKGRAWRRAFLSEELRRSKRPSRRMSDDPSLAPHASAPYSPMTIKATVSENVDDAAKVPNVVASNGGLAMGNLAEVAHLKGARA